MSFEGKRQVWLSVSLVNKACNLHRAKREIARHRGRMVAVYVRTCCRPGGKLSASVFALLLPSADSESWEELSVERSALGGFGVFVRSTAINNLLRNKTPVMLPYFGLETDGLDSITKECLLEVLAGKFERMKLNEVESLHSGAQVAGHFAVPCDPCVTAPLLSPETCVLRVDSKTAGTNACMRSG